MHIKNDINANASSLLEYLVANLLAAARVRPELPNAAQAFSILLYWASFGEPPTPR